ncbi:MAG: hypothetical protein RTV31_05640 [Candidatus Thorarchaeota archaeon]
MMEDKNLRNVYPISWITESKHLIEFIERCQSASEDDMLVADFASGEYDRVPTYFARILPEFFMPSSINRRIIVYCTDIHALRLDSLYSKLEEEESLSQVRVVQAALETMDTSANLQSENLDYVNDNPDIANWLDDFLIGEQCFPTECFDIGILNNDVIGYMYEYYTEYSDAEKGLQKIWKLIRSNGLLIVTMPCLQYKVDNIAVLEEIGFTFLEGLDIILSTGEKTLLEKNVGLDELSKLGHYTFLIFSKA